MENKKCRTCNIEKPLDCYRVLRNKQYYYTMSKCSSCYKEEINERVKKKYKKDSEYREYVKNKAEQWRLENSERYINNIKRNYILNKDKHNERVYKHKKEKGVSLKVRYCNNNRARLRRFLKETNKVKYSDLVGCSNLELRNYLEKKFKDGMNWDNYGYYGWHIDHIIPLSSAKTDDELKKLMHYTNLQPLWARENLNKGAKILSNSNKR